MTLLLASTFTDSLAKLTGDEQKAVKTAASDLQMNPGLPAAQGWSHGLRREPSGGPC